MKNPGIILFLILGSLCLSAQDKYATTFVCSNGKIHFFSSSPLEDIEATSRKAICVINTENKKVYAKVQMKTFEFRDKLMQEHFNENYIESDKYPVAILDMVITNDIDFAKDGVYDVTLKGTFEVHGVKQEREVKGKLTIKNGAPVNAIANFDVALVDHKIKIPKAVIMNIAEVIKVDVDFTFEKYQKQ
jgi:hypothetical protein